MRYHDANKEALGVRLRRFQSWFTEREKDKVKMEKRAQLKPKTFRLQNKVMFQASRNRPTNEQKLQLLEQYDREKSINPGLTIKSFCATRPGLNPKTFGPWLDPLTRTQIEIDASTQAFSMTLRELGFKSTDSVSGAKSWRDMAATRGSRISARMRWI